MITAELDDLAERDPALAGLPILLDAGVLSLLKGRLIESIRPDYLRYKPSTSLTVGYRTSCGPMFGYAVSPEAAPKLEKVVGKAPPGSIVFHDRQRRMIIARPAADRDLPGLRTQLGAAAEPLAYKPQRRMVAALLNRPDEPDRMLRCYRPADARATGPRWPGPGLVDGVRTPAVLDTDPAAGMIGIEWLPGIGVEQLHGTDLISSLERAGAALARWHRAAPTARRTADLPDLEQAADQLAQLLPDEADRIGELVAAIRDLIADDDHGWCHGDFSTDQLLVTDDGAISLLDWDRSGYGPFAVDLANADTAGIRGTAGLAPDEWQALLTGYQAIRPLPPGLDRFRALTRFTRAADPFRGAAADWPAAVTANLDRVEAMLR